MVYTSDCLVKDILSGRIDLQSCWPAGEMQLFARSYAKCWRSHESASTEKRCLEVILPNHLLEHARRRFPNCKKVPPFSVWGFKELMDLDVCWSTASWDWRGTIRRWWLMMHWWNQQRPLQWKASKIHGLDPKSSQLRLSTKSLLAALHICDWTFLDWFFGESSAQLVKLLCPAF